MPPEVTPGRIADLRVVANKIRPKSLVGSLSFSDRAAEIHRSAVARRPGAGPGRPLVVLLRIAPLRAAPAVGRPPSTVLRSTRRRATSPTSSSAAAVISHGHSGVGREAVRPTGAAAFFLRLTRESRSVPSVTRFWIWPIRPESMPAVRVKPSRPCAI